MHYVHRKMKKGYTLPEWSYPFIIKKREAVLTLQSLLMYRGCRKPCSFQCAQLPCDETAVFCNRFVGLSVFTLAIALNGGQ